MGSLSKYTLVFVKTNIDHLIHHVPYQNGHFGSICYPIFRHTHGCHYVIYVHVHRGVHAVLQCIPTCRLFLGIIVDHIPEGSGKTQAGYPFLTDCAN